MNRDGLSPHTLALVTGVDVFCSRDDVIELLTDEREAHEFTKEKARADLGELKEELDGVRRSVGDAAIELEQISRELYFGGLPSDPLDALTQRLIRISRGLE